LPGLYLLYSAAQGHLSPGKIFCFASPMADENPLYSSKKSWHVVAAMIKSGINTVYCYFIRNGTTTVVMAIHALPDTTKQHMSLPHSQRRSESGKKVLVSRIIYVYLWMLSLIICAIPVK
jgi:hypothetical protein